MAIYRRKVSPLPTNEVIDYKDVELLSKFLTEQGKILPRRMTGLTTKQQTRFGKTEIIWTLITTQNKNHFYNYYHHLS